MTAVLAFVLKNWKSFAIGAGAIVIVSFAFGAIKGWETKIRNEEIAECNAGQLQNQIDILNQQLETERLDKIRLSEEIKEIDKEKRERERYIDRLHMVLDNPETSDDEISEKTRQFIIELNEQNKNENISDIN